MRKLTTGVVRAMAYDPETPQWYSALFEVELIETTLGKFSAVLRLPPRGYRIAAALRGLGAFALWAEGIGTFIGCSFGLDSFVVRFDSSLSFEDLAPKTLEGAAALIQAMEEA